MNRRSKPWIAAAALLTAACGGQRDGESQAAGAGPAGNAAAAAGTKATPAPSGTAAPLSLALAADGLRPGIIFGMKQADAVAAATAALGAAGKPQHNDECGEGPMDLVGFGALQLAFQDGRLAGWSLNEGEPALRTESGLRAGAPRSALGDLEIDEDSSLGPEFDANGVGGVLDEKGERVIALWAGSVCQFR